MAAWQVGGEQGLLDGLKNTNTPGPPREGKDDVSTNYNATLFDNITATPNVSFTYDAAGNRTSMTDGLGSVSYNYNTLSQLTSETRTFTGLNPVTLSYAYNLGGELTSITNPWDVQVGYGYDQVGRPTSVSGSGYAGVSSYINSIAYRAFGVKQMNYANSRTLSLQYDNRMRVARWDVPGVMGWNYSYNNFGENTGRVTYAQNLNDATLDRSYDYDHVGRLIEAHTGSEARGALIGQGGAQDGPYSHSYRYDQFGNPWYRVGWGGSHGAWLEEWPAYTNNRRNGLQYDAAGNLTNDGYQSYTYDATGQQTYASATGLSQSYDGDRLRVKKTENGVTTYQLRSTVLGGQIVADLNSSGTWTRGYVYLGGQMLAILNDGVNWVHQDPVTKSQRVTNSGGTVTSTLDLDPWGGETNRSSNAAFQPHRYTTYERDANGADDAMMRRYQPSMSRFSQPDSYDGSYSLSDPQSLNRYAYTQNDPVNFVDPSGLDNHVIIPPNETVTVPISFDSPLSISGDSALASLLFGLRAVRFLAYIDPIGVGGDPQHPAPTQTPPIDKGYAWWGECNRSANDLMRTVRRDFSKFGNYSEVAAGGLGVAGIKFESGAISQGRTIGITIGANSTVNPSISYSRSMSVTVSSASTASFTFTTNPGHVFYPGTISFSSRDTNSGVRFGIDLKGQFGDAASQFGFNVGGADFEDRAWRNFLEKVRISCGHQPRN